MRARLIYEKFTQDSDPIHDMKIGYDPRTIEGFLTIKGFKNVKITNSAFGIMITFEQKKYKFTLSIIKKEVMTSIKLNLCTFLITIAPKFYKPLVGCMVKTKNISEENIIRILKRLLNKYYKDNKITNRLTTK